MRSIVRARNFIGIAVVACLAGLLLAQGWRLPAAAAGTLETISTMGGSVTSVAVDGSIAYVG